MGVLYTLAEGIIIFSQTVESDILEFIASSYNVELIYLSSVAFLEICVVHTCSLVTGSNIHMTFGWVFPYAAILLIPTTDGAAFVHFAAGHL